MGFWQYSSSIFARFLRSRLNVRVDGFEFSQKVSSRLVAGDHGCKLRVITDEIGQFFEENRIDGLAAYRSGNYGAAASELQGLIPHLFPITGASAEAVLAMARARLGKTESARAALGAATVLLNANWFSKTRVALEGNPHDWLIAHILVREAKSLIGPGK
jgi:hypothetical protein